MIQTILANIVIIQIIILAMVGSLVGELFRNVSTTKRVTFLRCVADFLASALFAVMFGLITLKIITKDRIILSIITLYMGFTGYSVSSKYAQRIWDATLQIIIDQKLKNKNK